MQKTQPPPSPNIRSSSPVVLVERDGGVGSITLNRPDKLNPLNQLVADQLLEAVLALSEDRSTSSILIQGAGTSFSAGIDLFAVRNGGIGHRFFETWERLLRVIEDADKIVVCALRGYVLGGGLQLALACDIRLSTPQASFGLPAVKEALMPGLAPWRLPRYIGWGRAKHMVLSGDCIDGVEAERIGLVDELAYDGDLNAVARDRARWYADNSTVGTRMSKRMLTEAFDVDFDTALEHHLDMQQRCLSSFESQAVRGVNPFDGRPPESASTGQ